MINKKILAEILLKLIPSSCPFERDLKLFGLTLIHIPPLCHFNPFYPQLMSLRWQASSYLTQLNHHSSH